MSMPRYLDPRNDRVLFQCSLKVVRSEVRGGDWSILCELVTDHCELHSVSLILLRSDVEDYVAVGDCTILGNVVLMNK